MRGGSVKPLPDLREKGEIAVRVGAVVGEAGVGELRGAKSCGKLHERARRRIVPDRLRGRHARDGQHDEHRGDAAAKRRDERRCLCRVARNRSMIRESRQPRTISSNGSDDDRRRRFASSRTRATAAVRAALVPVWRDYLLDTETPVAVFAKLREPPFAFLLESAPAGGETWARYTFLGTAPRARVAACATASCEDWTPDRGWHNARRPTDPLADLDALLRRYRAGRRCRSSASSGAAPSAFSATMSCAYIERLPTSAARARTRRRSRRAVRLHERARHLRQPARSGAGRRRRARRRRR